MSQSQYAIMRFAKYKGPEITNIEAHNERRKEKYASNPDIDLSRSKHNFHLIEPPQRYRAEAERQISAAGCRTRKDSVRLVEILFTATPEFFKGKKLPGHLGAERVTIQNLTVVKVDAENNLIAIKGAVPGPKGAVVCISDSVKA